MKKTFLSFLCLMFLAATVSAADWHPQQLSPDAFILFPVMPAASHTPEQTNYILQIDSCTYLVQIKPYMDGARVHDSATLTAFYDGMAGGILRAAKGTLMNKSLIDVSGLKGLKLEYVRSNENSMPVTVSAWVVLVNGDVIVYSFASRSEQYTRLQKNRDFFLSSLSFKTDVALTQFNTSSKTVSAVNSPFAAASQKADTSAHAPLVPTRFIDSHAGWIIKVLGMLMLFSAVIYFCATLSRRKE